MPANAVRGIGRWSTSFVEALVSYHPELIAAVSIDRRLPVPSVVQLLAEDVPVLFSKSVPQLGAENGWCFTPCRSSRPWS